MIQIKYIYYYIALLYYTLSHFYNIYIYITCTIFMYIYQNSCKFKVVNCQRLTDLQILNWNSFYGNYLLGFFSPQLFIL